LLSGATGHETIDGEAQEVAVAEDRGDVLEKDSCLWKIRHVAHGSAQSIGFFHQSPKEISAALAVSTICPSSTRRRRSPRDGNVERQIAGNYHRAKLFLHDKLNGLDAEARPENPVQRGGRAASLKVAELAGANFFASACGDFGADDFADAAEAMLAAGGRVAELLALFGRGPSETTIMVLFRPLSRAAGPRRRPWHVQRVFQG
jgi:hypothetical protein